MVVAALVIVGVGTLIEDEVMVVVESVVVIILLAVVDFVGVVIGLFDVGLVVVGLAVVGLPGVVVGFTVVGLSVITAGSAFSVVDLAVIPVGLAGVIVGFTGAAVGSALIKDFGVVGLGLGVVTIHFSSSEASFNVAGSISSGTSLYSGCLQQISVPQKHLASSGPRSKLRFFLFLPFKPLVFIKVAPFVMISPAKQP